MEDKFDIKRLRSNVTVKSNVYVVSRDHVNKLNDPLFMSHVVDPAAINEMRKNFALSKQQRYIIEIAMPCAKSTGYTFGIMCLDGKYVRVNRCNRIKCPEYRKYDTSKHGCNSPSCHPDYIPLPYYPPVYVTRSRIPPRKDEIEKYRGSIHLPGPGLTFDPLDYDIVSSGNKHNSWTRGYCKKFRDGAIVYIRPHLKIWGIRHYRRKIIFSFIDKSGRVKLLKFRDKCYERRIKERPELAPKNDTFEDNANYVLKRREFIKTPDVIVTSPIDSRILVNSGPGTGKTYTVIERLKYIVKNDLMDPQEVFVLCFSRNAVKVIRDRLADAMKKGEIPYSATKFNIYTFDSFVTSYLYQMDETPYSGDAWNSYDERIRQFIRSYKANPDVLNESMRYLIVDEMQDIVKDRAELVQILLSKIPCGFLLLGDLCQAIYDYSIGLNNDPCASKMKASELYKWIDSEAGFSDELLEYEITKNSRSDEVVEKLFRPLRETMLGKDLATQKTELNKVVDTLTSESAKFLYSGQDCSVAYLSWANSDAFSKSKELYSKSLNHEFRAGNRRLVFCRELADILSGYERAKMSVDEFMSRGESKGIDSVLLDNLWNGILDTMDLDYDESEIGMEKLNKCLSMDNKVRDSLLVRNTSNRTVSTVHKAKGSEYDFVELTINGVAKNKKVKVKKEDDVKVYYVALTRARHGVEIVRKKAPIDIRNDSNRFFKLNDLELSHFELGMDGDIDPMGFVANDIKINTVEERQRYIAENVHPCDPIQVKKVDDNYYIVHNGFVIGRMKPEIFGAFSYHDWWGHGHTCFLDDVSVFTELYVGNVVTIVEKRRDRCIPESYLTTGIWYGIDFCGMAKAQGQ